MTNGVIQKEATHLYQAGERDDWYFVAGMTTLFLRGWAKREAVLLFCLTSSLWPRRLVLVFCDILWPGEHVGSGSAGLASTSTGIEAWLMVADHLLDVSTAFPFLTVEERSLQKTNRCLPGRRKSHGHRSTCCVRGT